MMKSSKLPASVIAVIAFALGAAAPAEARDKGSGKSADRATERADRDRDRADRDRVDRDDRVRPDGDRTTGGDARDPDKDREPPESELIRADASDSENSGSGSSGSGSSDDDDNDYDYDFDDDDKDDDDDRDDEDDDKDDDDDDSSENGKVHRVEYDDAGNPYRADELVILSDDRRLAARAQRLGFGVIERRKLSRLGEEVLTLRKPEGMSSSRALDLLRAREPAAPSGYNYLYRASGAPAKTAGLDISGSKGSAAAVGVIDGFASEQAGPWPVTDLTGDPSKSGHGDAVTAILLGALKQQFGAAPSDLKLVNVVSAQSGGPAADVGAMIEGLDQIAASGARVSNISLAGPDHPALKKAISRTQSDGMVVVAAAGNGGPAAPPAYPAAYDGVIGVSAVDADGTPWLYSARGPQVDIAAAGVDVTAPGQKQLLSGTSYASPVVTAYLAVHLTKDRDGAEALLKSASVDAGTPGRDPVYGLGILTPGTAATKPVATNSQAARKMAH